MKRMIGIALALVGLSSGAWWMGRRSALSESSAVAAATHISSATDTGGMAPMPGMPGMVGTAGSAGTGTVTLTADQVREFGVTFGSAAQRVLRNVARATGSVAIDESRLTQVALRFGGFVERLYVDQTGQVLRRGDSLMTIYSPELLAAQQDLLTATDLQRIIGENGVPGLPGSSADLVTAARRRLQLMDVSDEEIDGILRARAPRRTLTVYAPASGIVLVKNVVAGQAVQVGQPLYTIANLDAVWIDVALREADAQAARVGAQAVVEVSGLPGRAIQGHVSYVYPLLDSVSRTVRARIVAPNPGQSLKPGMYATVTLTTASRRALTVPTSALFRTGKRTVVFVDQGDGATGRGLAPTAIEIGQVGDEYVEVLRGLVAGQRVATSAQFLLDSESNFAEVMQGMIGQMNASDLKRQPDMPAMPGMKMPAPPPTKR